MMPKWFSAITPLLLPFLLLAESAGLQQVQTVYLMPMGYGLDQYLANRLTAEAVLQVVTDPKRADAVFTDNIGVGFERRFEELLPREAPAAKKEDPPQSKKDADDEAFDRLKRASTQPPVSSFSRGKGNIFLVDVKTRSVVWALYERPKKILPDELNRTSVRIVERLKKDRSGKP